MITAGGTNDAPQQKCNGSKTKLLLYDFECSQISPRDACTGERVNWRVDAGFFRESGAGLNVGAFQDDRNHHRTWTDGAGLKGGERRLFRGMVGLWKLAL